MGFSALGACCLFNTSTPPSGGSSRSENSGVVEPKEDGQVSCNTAHNLRLLCSYITPHARATARPHAGASTSLAFSSSFSV